jgi:hypothetical protein
LILSPQKITSEGDGENALGSFLRSRNPTFFVIYNDLEELEFLGLGKLCQAHEHASSFTVFLGYTSR